MRRRYCFACAAVGALIGLALVLLLASCAEPSGDLTTNEAAGLSLFLGKTITPQASKTHRDFRNQKRTGKVNGQH